jgi:hypothetical protein
MSQPSLDERVTALEEKVAHLVQTSNGAQAPTKNWRSTLGMFAGDEVMKEIIEEGRKVREQDREQSQG